MKPLDVDKRKAGRATKYHQAALTYLGYGLVYWLGGFYLIEAGVSEQDGVLWLVIGAVFVLVFPLLIWNGYTWFTRILAVLVLVRIGGLVHVMATDAGATVPLPWGGALRMVYGAAVFLVVAAITCFMLVRAGWGLGRRPTDGRPRTADRG